MVHALLITVFTFASLLYLSWETRQELLYKKHIRYFYIAVGCTLIAYVLTAFLEPALGNFVYHGLGGGTATVFIYFYLSKTCGVHLNWRLELITLLAFTSTLGVLNELAEYTAELSGLALFSFDTHDTWRDFSANTLGMLLGWTFLKTVNILAKNRGK